MRNLCEPAIAKFRDHGADQLYGTADNERALGGAFLVPYKRPGKLKTEMIRVIASHGKDQAGEWRWDHVSVSLSNRCPTWDEMEYIKRLFFKPDEVAMQLHVGEAAHISMHPYCLHIWRPLDVSIPLPPSGMVGWQDAVGEFGKTSTAGALCQPSGKGLA